MYWRVSREFSQSNDFASNNNKGRLFSPRQSVQGRILFSSGDSTVLESRENHVYTTLDDLDVRKSEMSWLNDCGTIMRARHNLG